MEIQITGATFVLHKCYGMDNQRSYEKQSFKSNPTGIRFNLEQAKIALARSGKKTKQQLVDFLLENYVKGEVPTLERHENKHTLPQETYKPPPEIKKTPIEWVQEKREIPDNAAFQDFIKRLDAAKYLTEKERREIKFA